MHYRAWKGFYREKYLESIELPLPPLYKKEGERKKDAGF